MEFKLSEVLGGMTLFTEFAKAAAMHIIGKVTGSAGGGFADFAIGSRGMAGSAFQVLVGAIQLEPGLVIMIE